MTTTAMLDDIRCQPESLGAVADYQASDGAGQLRAAADAIRAAGRVVFTGMGSSLYASIPAASYLESRGFPAVAVDASEMLYFGSASRAQNAAVVLVSRSGETIEVTKLLDRIARSAIPTVGVANVRDSRLARGARCPIHVNSGPDRMISVQTYTGTLATLLLLAAAVLEDPPAEAFDSLGKAIEAVSAAIGDSLAAHREWSGFLAGAGVVYLLARGPSLASAHQGALLLNEAARTPSVAMSVAQFRHGPVEVVDERFRGVIFASQDGTRNADLALSGDLAAMGGAVRVCDGRGVPSPFEPLPEIVPLQVAACALALDKGIDPGDFRYAARVTLEETGFRKV